MQLVWLRRPCDPGFSISHCFTYDIQNSRSACGSLCNKLSNLELTTDNMTGRGKAKETGSTNLTSSARPGV